MAEDQKVLVVCYRSGHIVVLSHGDELPEGGITITRDERKAVEHGLAATARLAYDNKTWLVPGIPEAFDDDEAFEALISYRRRLRTAIDRLKEEPEGER